MSRLLFKKTLAVAALCLVTLLVAYDSSAADFGEYCRDVQLGDVTRTKDSLFVIKLTKENMKEAKSYPDTRAELDEWDKSLGFLRTRPPQIEEVTPTTAPFVRTEWEHYIPTSVTTRAVLLQNLFQVTLHQELKAVQNKSDTREWSDQFRIYSEILRQNLKKEDSIEARLRRKLENLIWARSLSEPEKFNYTVPISNTLSTLGSVPLCTWATGDLLHSFGCGKAFRTILDMRAVEAADALIDFSNLVYHLVLQSEIYEKALNRAVITFLGNSATALARLEHSPDASLDDFKSRLSFFEILRSEFLSLGFNTTEAFDRTLNLFSLYGMRGMNLFLISSGSPASLLQGIQSGLQYGLALSHFWDAILSMKKSKTLSTLPLSIRSQCDTGKFYHFWMSAYITRQLIKRGSSPRDAIHAAFTAQTAYQFVPFANPSWRIMTDPLTANWNSKEADRYRFDSMYAAAGARFGAGLQTRDLEVVFTRTKASSAALPALSQDAAHDLVNWNDWRTATRAPLFLKRISDQYKPENFLKFAAP